MSLTMSERQNKTHSHGRVTYGSVNLSPQSGVGLEDHQHFLFVSYFTPFADASLTGRVKSQFVVNLRESLAPLSGNVSYTVKSSVFGWVEGVGIPLSQSQIGNVMYLARENALAISKMKETLFLSDQTWGSGPQYHNEIVTQGRAHVTALPVLYLLGEMNMNPGLGLGLTMGSVANTLYIDHRRRNGRQHTLTLQMLDSSEALRDAQSLSLVERIEPQTVHYDNTGQHASDRALIEDRVTKYMKDELDQLTRKLGNSFSLTTVAVHSSSHQATQGRR